MTNLSEREQVAPVTAPAPIRLTPTMRRAEALIGEPLQPFIRRRFFVDGWTQKEIADALGVPAGTLSGWMVRFGISYRALAQAALASGEPA